MRWYFDFISPFAYLQSTQLQTFAVREKVECVPLLFAGLLDHWGNVGPAEIEPKRTWTFQHVIWQAHRDNIPFQLPSYHPFNPLPLLRLSIALDNRIEVVQRIFRFVWVEGKLPQEHDAFAALLTELGISAEQLENEAIKRRLRSNTEMAAEQGVFGVPTVVRQSQLFWGYDATDMALAHSEYTSDTMRWPEEKLDSVLRFKHGMQRIPKKQKE